MIQVEVKYKYGVKVTNRKNNCFIGWLCPNGDTVCRSIFPFDSYNEAIQIGQTILTHETMTIISNR